jgi:hypothetical protein
MPDNKSKRSGQDRNRVSTGQTWEMSYMKEKFNVSSQQVAGAVRAVGNNRKKVEEYLKGKSK